MNITALAAYEEIINKLVALANDRSDIRLVMVIGSRARVDNPADEWSDLDIGLIVTDTETYLSDPVWLKYFGDVRITFLELTNIGGIVERRVLFEGGLDVDFAIVSCAQWEQIQQHTSFSDTMHMLGQGIRVLIDKDERIPPELMDFALSGESKQPAQSDFIQNASDFWYHAVWTAKKLRRGEIWTAMMCCDSYMKWLMLKAIELHAKVINGPEYNTWYSGRFLEKWADTRVLDGLGESFACYSEDDVKRALLASMDLYRWITKETAKRLDYQYPATTDEYSTELVGKLLSGVN